MIVNKKERKTVDISVQVRSVSLQRVGKGTGRLEKKSASGNHPNYSIIKIGQNTEKSPGDLRRLAVTQTPIITDHC